MCNVGGDVHIAPFSGRNSVLGVVFGRGGPVWVAPFFTQEKRQNVSPLAGL